MLRLAKHGERSRKQRAKGGSQVGKVHALGLRKLLLRVDDFRDAELKEVDLAHVHGGERDTADAQGDERAATCSFSRGSFLKFFSIKPPAMRRWLIIGVGWREGIVKVVRRASPVYDGKGIPGRIAPLPK